MYASKGLIVGTAAVLLGLTATSVYDLHNGIDILISHNMMFNYLRIGLVGALGVLLVTQVPRAIATRAFVAVVALAVMIVNGYFLMNNQLFILDGMVFALVAVILALEAVELETPTTLVAPKSTPANGSGELA